MPSKNSIKLKYTQPKDAQTWELRNTMNLTINHNVCWAYLIVQFKLFFN